MRHVYLIDGYNLIHALGMIQRRLPAGGLEASRRRLLEFLLAAFDGSAAEITVVFDAMGNPGGGKRSQEHHGLHIRFPPRSQSADDLIETLIEQEADPQRLTVVSNDARLRHAAQRHGARAWSHDDLLDFLEKGPIAPPVIPLADDAEKPLPTSTAEMQHWLAEFEPLQHDPALKEFFDLDKFE